jgi:hypothetical protein
MVLARRPMGLWAYNTDRLACLDIQGCSLSGRTARVHRCLSISSTVVCIMMLRTLSSGESGGQRCVQYPGSHPFGRLFGTNTTYLVQWIVGRVSLHGICSPFYDSRSKAVVVTVAAAKTEFTVSMNISCRVRQVSNGRFGKPAPRVRFHSISVLNPCSEPKLCDRCFFASCTSKHLNVWFECNEDEKHSY